MGYYTGYEISIEGKSTEEMLELFESSNLIDKDIIHDLEDSGDELYIYCKWYDYEDEFIKLSKLIPNNLITIKGAGEESGDVWIHFIKNGLAYHQTMLMEYPEFNEDLLYNLGKSHPFTNVKKGEHIILDSTQVNMLVAILLDSRNLLFEDGFIDDPMIDQINKLLIKLKCNE